MTESDDVMQALIRDIQLARHNIEMVFYIWQPGGMADRGRIFNGRCTSWYSLPTNARLRRKCGFFRSPWPELMRNAGIEVVEALKVNLMRVFYAVWICANIAR